MSDHLQLIADKRALAAELQQARDELDHLTLAAAINRSRALRSATSGG